MTSDEYLIKLAEKRMERYMLKADKTAGKISHAYQKALNELCKSLEKIYSGLSVGITIAEAKRILNVVDSSNVDTFFSKAIDSISDPNTKEIMQSEFEKHAVKAKINQIRKLIDKIKTVCKSVTEKVTVLTDDCLNHLIPYAYYHSAYDEQRSSGAGMFLPLLTEERTDEIRLTNWSGIPYPQRIKNNGTRLGDLLVAEVLTGFFTKKNQSRMAEILAGRIAEAFNRSYTLLRTEACFVTNQAELQSYVDNGVTKYRYVAVLDMRTSKMCRELDGQEFDVDKALIGINFPPLHPHCRSTTRPVIEGEDLSEQERKAEDPQTGENMTVPADMTYNEWYEKYVDKSGESGIIKTEEVKPLEQAKKRDHKVYVTEVAIEKVDKVKLSDFTDKQADSMQKKHKELLKLAMEKNESNEVLFIDDLNFKSEVQILGDEFVVSPGKNPFAVSIVSHAERQSLIYLHNHPSTNTFSVGDIDTFACERAIKAISVVTNQGEVYILNKLDNYSFKETKKILNDIYDSFPKGEIDDKEFVSKFLKQCNRGGIEYAKSK